MNILHYFARFFKKRTKQLRGQSWKTEQYTCAGTIFTDGKLILAGYQPHKRVPFITGIGGSKYENETYLETAIRETLEELFEFETIPQALLYEIQFTVPPKRTLQNKNYSMVVYTFTDLETILGLFCKYELTSKVYDEIPKTLFDVLFRRNTCETAEISHVCILPFVAHRSNRPFVDKHFVKDIQLLLCQS